MKRMIDNKDYETLKDNVNEINEELELKDTNYIISSVVVESEEVLGFVIKDVKNSITYNIDLAGGGKKLYQHFYEYTNITSNKYASFNIINDKPTMSYAEIKQYFFTKDWTSYDKSIIYSIGGNSNSGIVYWGKVYYDSGNTKLVWLKMFSSTNFDLLDPADNTASIYARITSEEL